MNTSVLPPARIFGVRIVDEVTGRGVPLVELETVNHVRFVTDSNGWIAITDPDLMGVEVFFHIRSHGYTVPKDGFGYAGARLRPAPGGRAQVKIRRVNLAERLCRLTGGGIYADSLLLGERVPLRNPALAGQVVGQDSALAVVYKGKMLWFWGDTSRSGYPLGNFHTTGAIATLPKGYRTAEAGLDFEYFTRPDGFTRDMCPSDKPGPIWVSGVALVKDGNGESLIAQYARIKDLGTKHEMGYVRWDDSANIFRYLNTIPPTEPWRFLDGHPIRLEENGITYLAGGFCFPIVRVVNDLEKVRDPAVYEAFTCLTLSGEVMRNAKGEPNYRWQKDAPPISSAREAELVKQGKLKPQETYFLPRDPAGNPVVLHGGSVTWNPWRKKWIMIATQKSAKESEIGEIFYSEANQPTGPWKRAVKVITHDKYTFYNPVHHPFLDASGGRIIHFEGTYTAEFSGNTNPTPRYDYNQMLYRLDLNDPRLDIARAD
jgi:hypothetical protein